MLALCHTFRYAYYPENYGIIGAGQFYRQSNLHMANLCNLSKSNYLKYPCSKITKTQHVSKILYFFWPYYLYHSDSSLTLTVKQYCDCKYDGEQCAKDQEKSTNYNQSNVPPLQKCAVCWIREKVVFAIYKAIFGHSWFVYQYTALRFSMFKKTRRLVAIG